MSIGTGEWKAYWHTSLSGLTDLVFGTTIATLLNGLFSGGVSGYSGTPEKPNIAIIGLDAAIQSTLTLIISTSLRSMIYSKDYDDPMGGILFILSVFRQPTFWNKVSAIQEFVTGYFTGNNAAPTLLPTPNNA